jgi:ribosomal protein S12 methylthiotransferase accessory factor YcaO
MRYLIYDSLLHWTKHEMKNFEKTNSLSLIQALIMIDLYSDDKIDVERVSIFVVVDDLVYDLDYVNDLLNLMMNC